MFCIGCQLDLRAVDPPGECPGCGRLFDADDPRTFLASPGWLGQLRHAFAVPQGPPTAERRTLAQWTQWELAWRRDDLCPRCRYPVGTSPFCTECGLALDAPALTQAEREDQGNLDPFSAEPKGEEPG